MSLALSTFAHPEFLQVNEHLYVHCTSHKHANLLMLSSSTVAVHHREYESPQKSFYVINYCQHVKWLNTCSFLHENSPDFNIRRKSAASSPKWMTTIIFYVNWALENMYCSQFIFVQTTPTHTTPSFINSLTFIDFELRIFKDGECWKYFECM